MTGRSTTISAIEARVAKHEELVGRWRALLELLNADNGDALPVRRSDVCKRDSRLPLSTT